jgi:cyanophycin synthetase
MSTMRTEAVSVSEAVFVAGPHHFMPGWVLGRRQPSLVVSLQLQPGAAQALQACARADGVATLWRAWQAVAPAQLAPWVLTSEHADWARCVQAMGSCTVALMQRAGLPVFEAAHPWSWTPPDARRVAVLLPVATGRQSASMQAWLVTLKVFDTWLRAGSQAQVRQLLEEGLAQIGRLAPAAANTPRFLRAAFEAGIPVTALGLDVFQYGQGSQAVWLDSSFTSQTSTIAAKLARSKPAAAARLRQAGLPVPAHHPVANLAEAVKAAQGLGYPVVVKPADLDGGNGVAAGLQTEAELRVAYETARALSPRVLVEKHVVGRDYRLTVLDGELLWAIERVPAGVTGDGVRSVAELVEQENADPRRGEGAHAALKRLALDDDARQLLLRHGLTEHGVPAVGQFVALRRIANVATGGRPLAVNDTVHPDNAALAVRAAQALRLDLAGVDVLMPDIAQSWRVTGAAICEVNAQPQLGATTGPHLYGAILRRRLPGDGRVPVVVVLGQADGAWLTRMLADGLSAAGYAVGCADQRGVVADGVWLHHGPQGSWAAGQLLLTHPAVDALVLAVLDDEPLRLGLPLDRIDWLVVAGTQVAPPKPDGSAPPGRPGLVDALLAGLWGFSAGGRVVNVQGSGLDSPRLAQAAGPMGRWETLDSGSLLAWLLARPRQARAQGAGTPGPTNR